MPLNTRGRRTGDAAPLAAADAGPDAGPDADADAVRTVALCVSDSVVIVPDSNTRAAGGLDGWGWER
jgi:hypothetical protein